MRHMTGKLAASALILGLATAGIQAPAAAKTTTLAPLSPWAVDFGENRCRLARTFGDADNKHVAIFDQFGPSRRFVLTLAGPSFRKFRGRTETITRYSDSQEPFESLPYAGDLGDFGKAIIFRGLGLTGPLSSGENEAAALPGPSSFSTAFLLDVDAANAVEFVSVRQRKREVRLQTGDLGDAFKVLNDCTMGLVESWGLDRAAHLSARSLPKWLNEEEIAKGIAGRYPNRALRKGESGFVNLRVMVSEAGTMTECVVENVTEAQALDSPACAEMRKAEFEPALDAEGQPMKSFYQTRITYRIN